MAAPHLTAPVRIVDNAGGVHVNGIEPSPDGTRVAFMANRNAHDDVFVVDVNAPDQVHQLNITATRQAIAAQMTWVADGHALAWSGDFNVPNHNELATADLRVSPPLVTRLLGPNDVVTIPTHSTGVVGPVQWLGNRVFTMTWITARFGTQLYCFDAAGGAPSVLLNSEHLSDTADPLSNIAGFVADADGLGVTLSADLLVAGEPSLFHLDRNGGGRQLVLRLDSTQAVDNTTPWTAGHGFTLVPARIVDVTHVEPTVVPLNGEVRRLHRMTALERVYLAHDATTAAVIGDAGDSTTGFGLYLLDVHTVDQTTAPVAENVFQAAFVQVPAP
jgi:hypothetical protein